MIISKKVLALLGTGLFGLRNDNHYHLWEEFGNDSINYYVYNPREFILIENNNNYALIQFIDNSEKHMIKLNFVTDAKVMKQLLRNVDENNWFKEYKIINVVGSPDTLEKYCIDNNYIALPPDLIERSYRIPNDQMSCKFLTFKL